MGNRVKIIINGVPPWDGEYEFESLESLTNREAYEIKEISKGVRLGELKDALVAGDTGAWVGLAEVVAARHGKQIPPDDLWDVPAEAIMFGADKKAKVNDADPPTTESSNGNSSESKPSSGLVSESVGV